jgi:hypothetical protein
MERKFAHSLKFVLPSTTAPAARSRATISASLRECQRAGARRHSVGRVDAGFQQHRNAVQRPERAPAELLVELPRDPLGVGVHLDDGRKHRSRVVERRDPAQIGLRDLERR